MIIVTIAINPVIAQAADWSFALGGTHTGVYLLYGHPTCDWSHTLQNINKKKRFQGCSPASFRNKR
eukprot:770963-Prorocentrum_lima.AAC.1